MKLSKNVFVKGIDSNTNPDMISNDSYVSARNVISTGIGFGNALTNMKGIEDVSSFNYNWRDTGVNVATDWRCVGMEASPSGDYIYIFMYADTAGSPTGSDYSDRSFLFGYNTTGFAHRLIMAGYDDVVEWSQNILDFNVITFRNEDYLFWINYDGNPYKVNILEAYNFMDNIQYSTPTTAEKNAIVSVVAIPPLNSPIAKYTNINSIEEGNIISGIYNFKYRYIYDDGNISAFSPVSKIFYDWVIASGNDSFTGQYYNAVELSYEETSSNIRAVEFAIKKDTAWYLIPILESQGKGSHTYIFGDNKSLIALGEDSFNTKYYDNLPINANSQELIKNKLAYSNYIDNYDSILDLDANVSPRYIFSSLISTSLYDTASAVYTQYDFGGGLDDWQLDISLSDIQAISEIGDYIYWNIYEFTFAIDVLKFHKWKAIGSLKITDWGTLLQELGDGIVASSSDAMLPSDGSLISDFMTVVADYSSGTNCLIGLLSSGVGGYMQQSHLSLGGNSFVEMTISNSSITKTFKSGASHTFGVVYYDKYNRQNDVATTDSLSVYVKLFGERAYLVGEPIGPSNMVFNIASTPPEWATHYQIVYSKNTSTSEFDTYLSEGFVNELNEESDPTGNKIIEMPAHTKFIQKNKNAQANYIFSEGDRLVITGWYDSVSKTIKQENMSNFSVPIIGAGYNSTGIFGVTITELAAYDIGIYTTGLGASALYEDYFLFEIRNSIAGSINSLFYEIGEEYEIGDAGLPTRYHKGEYRDQNEDVSLLTTNLFLIYQSKNLYRTVAVGGLFANWQLGDRISIYDGASTYYGQIVENAGGSYIRFRVDDDSFVWTDITYTISVVPSAVVEIEDGDAYFRTRNYVVDFDTLTDIDVIVETDIAIDGKQLVNEGLGRGQLVKRNKYAIDRTASIILSQQNNDDAGFFGSTSFPNTAYDYVDLDNSFSQIDKIINIDDNLYVLQESRAGVQLVDKDIITSATGGGMVSTSSSVFGPFQTIVSGVGTRGDTNSIQTFNGMLIFYDKSLKSVYLVSKGDYKNISKDAMFTDLKSNTSTDFVSGIIPTRGEYLLSIDKGVLTYNILEDKWVSYNDFSPELIATAKDNYYSICNGKLFKHESTTNYNQFYNSSGVLTYYPSIVSVVSNQENFKRKSYESVELLGYGLDIRYTSLSSVTTDNSATSTIDSFVNKEGSLYASIGGGYDLDTTFNTKLLGIGRSSSYTSTSVTFDELPSYVVKGDILYQHDGALINELIGTISDVTGLTVTVPSVTNPIVDSRYYTIAKPSVKDGSAVKGRYLSFNLNFGLTGSIEAVTSIDTEGTVSSTST